MTATKTSINAYYNYAISQESTQFEKILAVMNPQKSYTRRELHHLTGIETSTIAARVNSLIKQEKIKKNGKKICPFTNIEVQSLAKVVKEPVQLRLL